MIIYYVDGIGSIVNKERALVLAEKRAKEKGKPNTVIKIYPNGAYDSFKVHPDGHIEEKKQA